MINTPKNDAEMEEAERALAARMTQDTIDLLVDAMRVCGFAHDLWEVESFVRWLADLRGLHMPTRKEIF